MKFLLIAGFAGLSVFTATPLSAGNESVSVQSVGAPGYPGFGRWGGLIHGRWIGGYNAPGGWGAYQIPYRGFVLPSYWLNPIYRISSYPIYGLYAPSFGLRWSRYYDDAVLSDAHGRVHDYRSGIAWDRYEGGYADDDFDQADLGPTVRADRQVYFGNEQVHSNERGPVPAPVFRPGTGERQDAPAPGAPYPVNEGHSPTQLPAMQAYQSRVGFERYERCLKERGIAGGLIGGIVGAVVGNRVGGRGNRTIGSILGGAAGAVAGASIEKAVNKCKKYLPRDDRYYYDHSGYPGGYYPQGFYYYYPQQAPVVTTVTVTPAVTTTTTVTEEVYYETVPVHPKKRVTKKWKPKPKPRCVCR
jgi:hypothetical protein